MRHRTILMLLAVVLLAFTSSADAQIIIFTDRNLGFQGSIDPPLDSAVSMTFTLFEDSTGGVGLWTETRDVDVTGGRFSVLLGEVTPFGDIWFINATYPKYLEITVGGETLTPRTELGAVPVSYVSGRMSGDVVTEPGKLMVKDFDCAGDSCSEAEVMAIGGTGTLSLRNLQANPESASMTVQTEIVSLDFSYDGRDRFRSTVDADSTETALLAYGVGGDTTGVVRNTVRHGSVSNMNHALLNGEFRGVVESEVDSLGARTSYRWDFGDSPLGSFAPKGKVVVLADSMGSSVTTGLDGPDEFQIVVQASSEAARIGLGRMGSDVLQLRADSSGGQITLKRGTFDTLLFTVNGGGMSLFRDDGSLGFDILEGGWTLYGIGSTNPRGEMNQSGFSLYDNSGDLSLTMDPSCGSLVMFDTASGDTALSFSGCGNSPLLTSKRMSIGKMTAPMGVLDVAGGTPPVQYLITAENSDGDAVFEVGQIGPSRYGQVKIKDSAGVEQVRLSSVGPSFFTGGRLGIGTATPTVPLEVVGDICASGSIGQCSDVRYKKEIHTIEGALERIEQIRGVRFDWKRDQYPERRFADGEQIGFIAQEMEDVIPEVVSADGNGYRLVDYGRLSPLLVEAIKEQQEQIKSQQAMIEALLQRVEQLEAAR